MFNTSCFYDCRIKKTGCIIIGKYITQRKYEWFLASLHIRVDDKVEMFETDYSNNGKYNEYIIEKLYKWRQSYYSVINFGMGYPAPKNVI